MSIGFPNREVFRNDFDDNSRLRAVISQHSPRLRKACVTRRVRTPEETKAAEGRGLIINHWKLHSRVETPSKD
jgi:hypothetical protein